MNLTKLRYFYTICAFESYSDAAKYLHVSQPSLSNAIKDLEDEFEVTLFSRHYRGVSLTPEGQVLYKLSKDVLTRTEQAENIMKELGSGRKKLRLGIPPMFGLMILPRIYKEFLSRNPDIELEITEGGRRYLYQKLSNDELDMVFSSHDASPDPIFATYPIAALETFCFVEKNNPITKHGLIDPTMLKDVPIVLFDNSYYQTEKIKSWFQSAHIEPNIILQTSQLSTLLSMVSNNLAVGFASHRFVNTSPTLLPIPIMNPMYANINLLWKKDSYFTNSMHKFKQYVEQADFFN